jgi:hypothetical protein
MPSARPTETPIERIFRKVMGCGMPPSIKAVLLRKSSVLSSPNVTDYPSGMSQWEKESLAAEARLISERKRKTRKNLKHKHLAE